MPKKTHRTRPIVYVKNLPLFNELKTHYSETPNEPLDIHSLFLKFGSSKIFSAFKNVKLPILSTKAQIAINQERIARGLPPIKFPPIKFEQKQEVLYTLAGKRFVIPQGLTNSYYRRVGLEAMIRAHLLDSPNKRIETAPFARFMGIDPKKPENATKIYHLHHVIDIIARRISKREHLKSHRLPGGPRPLKKEVLDYLNSLVRGKKEIRVVDVLKAVYIKTGVALSPDTIKRYARANNKTISIDSSGAKDLYRRQKMAAEQSPKKA